MKTRKSWMILFSCLLLLSGFGAFVALGPLSAKSFTFESQNKAVEIMPEMDGILKLQNVYRSIAKSLMPAVVSINVEVEQVVRNPYYDYFNDPFFRQFFGDEGPNQGPKEYKRKLQSAGSGFIVTKNGYIFSNNHVIKDATKIIVILSDNRKFEAKVVGADPETDIALLKINADNLPIVPLGDSSQVEVGDFTVAIGNPFGLSGTYSSGVISAIGRPGMTSGFQKFIQTDAAVNPGNSGGPLVNIKGQVIGINSAILSQTGGYQGISFAIPINLAKNIANQILDHGKIERGYIGVNISPIDETTRKLLGLKANEGVLVSKAEKGGPADKGGIKQGDVILSVNGELISSPEDLQTTIGSINPGTTVKITVLRNKARLDLSVKLNERPGQTAKALKQDSSKDNDKPQATYDFQGTTFADAPDSLLQQNGVPTGVLVKAVKEDSIFSGILEPGYLIGAVNQVEVKNLSDIKEFFSKNKNAKSFTFLIAKDGYMFYKGIEK